MRVLRQLLRRLLAVSKILLRADFLPPRTVLHGYPRPRAVVRRVRIIHVVGSRVGADDLVPQCRLILHVALVAHPVLNGILLRLEIIARERVAPEPRLTPLRVQILDDPVAVPALQRILVPEAELPHLRLTIRTALPMLLRRLIPADMNRLRRKQLAQLIQHIRQELETLLPPRADQIGKYAKIRGDRHRLSRASKLRICRNRRRHMPRNIDLRNDLHIPLLRELHDAPNLSLRIKFRS